MSIKKIQFCTRLMLIILVLAGLLVNGDESRAGFRNRLIKGSWPAVYYLDEDSNRHVFMNDKVYFSWYFDFSEVEEVSDDELANYPLAGVVTYKPGVRLVKIQSDPKVYAVDSGGELRWIKTEDFARALYGDNWNQMIDDVEPGFFARFRMGNEVEETSGFNKANLLALVGSIQDDIVIRRGKDNGTYSSESSGSNTAGGGGGGGGGDSDNGTDNSDNNGDSTDNEGEGNSGNQDPLPDPESEPEITLTYLFDDIVADGWLLSGWGGREAVVESGRIRATHQDAWSAITFDHRSEFWEIDWLTAGDYDYLVFDITPINQVSEGHNNLMIQLEGRQEDGTLGTSFTLSEEVSLIAGQTTRVELPMSEMAAGWHDFYRVDFYNNSGDTNFSYYLDNVHFTSDGVNSGSEPPALPEPDPEPAGSVSMSINLNADRTAISPYIYGTNAWNSDNTNIHQLFRMGGNRYSAYNWEVNSSNAGTDWYNSSDRWLSSNDGDSPNLNTLPGQHVKEGIARARSYGAASLITVPMLDYVVADANGTVNGTPVTDPDRWIVNTMDKAGALSMNPDLGDGVVYQEEFVNFIQQTYPDAQSHAYPTMYSLDNEPALWPDTHPLPHPEQTGYQELVNRSVNVAGLIKDLAPSAKIFGPALYGFYAFETLQDAPDGGGRNFIDYYLQEMRQASQTQGVRLLDVLDVHWYPEAHDGNWARITDNSTNPSPAMIEARVQAPRSLWDPTYVENSWIADASGGAVELLPNLQAQIEANYPGTKIAITEYWYGGGKHISGAIAQADFLGILGREGVYAATLWPFDENNSYTDAAFRMFNDYNLQGDQVAEYAVPVQTSDIETTSVYAFGNNTGSGQLQVMVINKSDHALSVTVDGLGGFSQAQGYRIQQGISDPVSVGSTTVSGGQMTVVLPAYSVTTYEL